MISSASQRTPGCAAFLKVRMGGEHCKSALVVETDLAPLGDIATLGGRNKDGAGFS